MAALDILHPPPGHEIVTVFVAAGFAATFLATLAHNAHRDGWTEELEAAVVHPLLNAAMRLSRTGKNSLKNSEKGQNP
jgi:hypothetical protein